MEDRGEKGCFTGEGPGRGDQPTLLSSSFRFTWVGEGGSVRYRAR